MQSWKYYRRLALIWALTLGVIILVAGAVSGVPSYSPLIWLRVIGSIALVCVLAGSAIAGVFVIKDWVEWKRIKGGDTRCKLLLIANRSEIARALHPLSLAERGRGVRGVQPPRFPQERARHSISKQRAHLFAPHPLTPSPQGRRGMVRAC